MSDVRLILGGLWIESPMTALIEKGLSMSTAVKPSHAGIRGMVRCKASLNSEACPYCPRGMLFMHDQPQLTICLDGHEVVALGALVNICDYCQGEVVTEHEWNRLARQIREVAP